MHRTLHRASTRRRAIFARHRIALAGRWLLPLFLLSFLFQPAFALDEPLRVRDGRVPDDIQVLPKSTMEDARSINHVEGGWLETEAVPGVTAKFDGSKSALVALLDKEPTTGLRLSAADKLAAAAIFAGAAEWTNQVEVTLRGRAKVTLDLLAPDGSWKPTGLWITPSGDAQRQIVDLPTGQIQGVRLRLDPASRDEVEVLELGAYWFEPELLKDAAETADEWCEDYPGTGNDLSSPNLTCQRFSDYLRDRGWTWLFDWGDNNAWEEDYKRVSLGGTNNSWIDATDIFIHCSHGITDQLFMARTDKDDAYVTWTDINGAWGDNDLEWVFVHCCLNMKTLAWHNAFNGAHTISGWKNVINSSANWGKTIAQKLWDSGFFDSAWTIYQSWWHSNDTNQPSGNIGRLLAEDYVHYNEYIWGQGPVNSDSPDGTHWWVEQVVSKAEPLAKTFTGNAVRRASTPIEWHAPANLGKPGQSEIKIFVYPEVLDEARQRMPEVVSMFQVLPSNMNEQVVATQLGRLCELLGANCPTLEAGREDETAYVAGAGMLSLAGANASGALLFTDQEKFLLPRERPPEIIDPRTAAALANEFLQAMNLLNPFHVQLQTVQLLATEVEGEGPDPRVLQQYPIGYEVLYGQAYDEQGQMVPVLGPGGRIKVLMGPMGGIQGFNTVNRQLEPVARIQPLAIEEALNVLAAFGYGAVQAAPEFPAREIVVSQAQVAYFEQGAFDDQPMLGPVYAFDVFVTGDDGQGKVVTEPGRLYVTADKLPVQSLILEPPDGAVVQSGQEIGFVGDAAEGTPPYAFEWSSNLVGFLSDKPTFSTAALGAGVKNGQPLPITVELKVTDANGYESTEQISLVFEDATSVDGPAPRFALYDNAPNPFNPRTTISFELARDVDVTLAVYDLRGRLVKKLLDREAMTAGRQARTWHGDDASGRPVAAGVYFYRVEARVGNDVVFSQEGKMSLVK